MLLDEVVARIEVTVPLLGGRVAGLAAFANLLDSGALPPETPAAYVVPLGLDPANPLNVTGGHQQVARESLGVILIISHADDAGGGAAMPDMAALRDAIIGGLAGWRPASGRDGLAVRRGRLLDMRGSAVIWQQDFSSEVLIRT